MAAVCGRVRVGLRVRSLVMARRFSSVLGVLMNADEYNRMFHKHQLNLVAFKRLMDCDEEVLRLINAAIADEREGPDYKQPDLEGLY